MATIVRRNESKQSDEDIDKRIFVRGFPKDTTEAQLEKFFQSGFGTVLDVNIIRDKHYISKGYGFVTFESQEVRDNFMGVDKLEYLGKTLNIGAAIRKERKPHSGRILHGNYKYHDSGHYSRHYNSFDSGYDYVTQMNNLQSSVVYLPATDGNFYPVVPQQTYSYQQPASLVVPAMTPQVHVHSPNVFSPYPSPSNAMTQFAFAVAGNHYPCSWNDLARISYTPAESGVELPVASSQYGATADGSYIALTESPSLSEGYGYDTRKVIYEKKKLKFEKKRETPPKTSESPRIVEEINSSQDIDEEMPEEPTTTSEN